MAVYKDKNGTWYVSARYTNWKGEADRKLKRGFQTKKEATEWERNFFLENAGNLEMTFEAFYELYKKNMQDRIKLSTWKMKESVIESKILPYFRKKRMCDIKPRDVVTWQNTMLKMRDDDGNPYSPVYLKTIHNQLSAIFNHAVKFYDLPNNPAQKAGNMGKEKSREMLFWTQEEYKAFAEAVMDKPISFYAFEVLYWGGLRLGELLALTRKDIDFKRGIIRINKSYQRIDGEDVITDPKTPNSVRNVQMPEFLAEELKDYLDSLYGLDDDTRIFPITKSYLHHEMRRGCEASGVKKIEDIKSFISRAKETYKVPYETHPADRLRQCVFGGSSNTMDFLPLDRSGNRRFLPIMVHPENAVVHILEDEAASRAFIDLMWAEAMFIYHNFPVKLTLSKDMDKELKELQKQFMPEDTKAGLIQSFLDNFGGTQVCSKLIYAEALNHPFDEPKQWEIREINEIMNNSIEGWTPFSNPRIFAKYGRQRGWERIPSGNELSATGSNLLDAFRELTKEEARQMELPF